MQSRGRHHGRKCAWGLTAAAEIFQPAEVVSVVDSVGAGDCFFAGLIAALIRDGAIETLRAAAPSQPTLSRARYATRLAAPRLMSLGRADNRRHGWKPQQREVLKRWDMAATCKRIGSPKIGLFLYELVS